MKREILEITKLHCIYILMTAICASCGVGNNQESIYITATSGGQCNPMTVGSCAINLTYNTNGIPNLVIGYNSSPQNQPAFNISTSNCVPQGTIGTQTCTVNIVYNPANCTPGNQNETVSFTLSSVTSNPVALSCNY